MYKRNHRVLQELKGRGHHIWLSRSGRCWMEGVWVKTGRKEKKNGQLAIPSRRRKHGRERMRMFLKRQVDTYIGGLGIWVVGNGMDRPYFYGPCIWMIQEQLPSKWQATYTQQWVKTQSFVHLHFFNWRPKLSKLSLFLSCSAAILQQEAGSINSCIHLTKKGKLPFIEHLIYAGHCSKCFIYFISLYGHSNSKWYY